MSDTLQRFMFDSSPVRGELVEIADAWQQIQARRSYPAPVATVLGEMMAAAALLSANLKFNGAIIMQIHGDGPVQLLVVECDSSLRMRATAKLAADAAIADDARLHDLVNLHGHGRFAITLDPADKLPGQQAYQGIVPLEGDTVAEALQHYMKASEQLDTRLWLAADAEHAAGMLIQRLPYHGGSDSAALSEQAASETWDRTSALAATLKRDELLATDIDTLIHRLFWEETLVAFEPAPVRWHCPCTRERVANMLRSLGEAEVKDILAERGQVDVSCDFCGKPYAFDAVDCAALFTGNPPASDQTPPTVH